MAWTIVVVLLCLSSPVAIAKEEDARGILDSLKESYDDLPEAGKFATGAVAGFGVTRFTVNKVVGVIKLAGAAFIAYVVFWDVMYVFVRITDSCKTGLTSYSHLHSI